MTDALQHECGIAMVRLLKPLEYYQLKYGTWMYGLQKLYLLMEKQRNRGQDGAGLVCVKFDPEPGREYIHRHRSVDENSIDHVFRKIYNDFDEVAKDHPGILNDPSVAKSKLPFAGEVYLGHLRYGTYGGNSIQNVHPVMRANNWKTRNLVMAGNFNMTNVVELFDILVNLGQHPKDLSDTVTVLENVGHFLDREVQRQFDKFKGQGKENVEITHLIAENLNLQAILRESSKKWDGGYAIAGIMGHGDSFVMRDPWGIRPAYYYYDDEVAVVASERPVIQTAFDLKADDIKELLPGKAIIMKKNGNISIDVVRESHSKRSCSFERIYFSRGSDIDIYKERKRLGELLVPDILNKVNYDLDNTVFSYIPNTAESAFYGLIEGMDKYLMDKKKNRILDAGPNLTPSLLDEILNENFRVEKVAVKDAKLRTFITQDKGRNNLVGHVYDITYGTIKAGSDNLVIIDDSIVRGTTLKHSIIKILDRLDPIQIVIVSSSPQIRYPDCYGIDMAKLSDFIAFQAAIALLKETGKSNIINEVYNKCKASLALPKEKVENHVKAIYTPFSAEEISDKIAAMLRTPDTKAKISVVYQTVENLHVACTHDSGDWYFTGNYPTPGGNRVANNSFINYVEGRDHRAY
jgi:amidophosphoribosyltransferase